MIDEKPKVIICDIDGTLANIEHRRGFVTSDKKDWFSFNRAMVGDIPNEWCVDIINKFKNEIGYSIIFVTGREEAYREITSVQINHWLGEFGYHIFMRPNKDYRKDSIVKEEIYNREIKDKYNVSFVIDDRATVTEMWRNKGLVCLQCSRGDF